MKAVRQIFAGLLAVTAMACFVGSIMAMQTDAGTAAGLFLGFLFLGWFAKHAMPE